ASRHCRGCLSANGLAGLDSSAARLHYVADHFARRCDAPVPAAGVLFPVPDAAVLYTDAVRQHAVAGHRVANDPAAIVPVPHVAGQRVVADRVATAILFPVFAADRADDADRQHGVVPGAAATAQLVFDRPALVAAAIRVVVQLDAVHFLLAVA